MPPLSDQQNKAHNLLEKLFSILEEMVTKTIGSQQQSNSESCRPLSDIQKDLNELKSCFTNDKCPILDEVANHLDDYKAKVNGLLANKPQATDAPNSDPVRQEIRAQSESA